MTGKTLLGLPNMDSRRARTYRILAAFLIVWNAILIIITVAINADFYYYSYYSVDYSFGLVRRGLAGELLNLFPAELYFTGLKFLRWFPTIVYAFGLAALAGAVALQSGRSERRVMLGLLVAVLPFGAVFALVSARPDVLGGAVVAFFAVAIAIPRSDRFLRLASTGYGLLGIPLTLMHEATPFLYSLGVVATIVVLGRRNSLRAQFFSAVIATGPGLATGGIVALLGRRGISAQQCAIVPHGMINHPLAGKPTPNQILHGFRYYVDYHDWFCRFMLPYFDQGFNDALHFVASRGFILLSTSALFGVIIFAVTMSAIARVSGVPFSRFTDLLRVRRWWILAGLLLFLPVFLTGVDWTRWFVTMSFDLGIPYLLFSSAEPEADVEPTSRDVRFFVIGIVLLAVIPIGVVPGFAGTLPG